MYVLFVSRLSKVFHVRKATGPAAYEPPNYPDVSLVDDSIEGWLDCLAEVARIAKEEGWRTYDISIS
jgi:hypothetical protein